MTDQPVVTFVVPCYNLAHYLQECVASILRQDFRELEVLILDDCSPDDTADVARRIVEGNPARVSYVRNAVNLGAIRTYNAGIGMARGRYVWILSPDDRLRSMEIVRRYVEAMEKDRDIGFAFCPAHTIRDEVDLGIREGSRYSGKDQVLDGRYLAREIISNEREVVAPSVMVRRSCYERIAMFPEDLPHRGDTYVWSSIAMRHKAAFFAEAMVDYRVHERSMMSTLARTRPQQVIADDILVLWRLRDEAASLGMHDLAGHCYDRIIVTYARLLLGNRFRGTTLRISPAEFEASLRRHVPGRAMRFRIRAEVLAGAALRVGWRSVQAVLGRVAPRAGAAH